MNSAGNKPQPVWLQIVRQSLLGPRGLTKSSGIWFAMAVLVCLRTSEPSGIPLLDCLLIWLAGSCRTIGGILINDLVDREDDNLVGKTRWIQRFPPLYGFLIVSGLFGIGFLCCLAAASPLLVGLMYLAAALLSIAYSAPPFRFKARGVIGLWQYGICCAVGYIFFPWTWLDGGLGELSVLAVTVFLDKWVMLNFHQIIDYQADIAAKCQTYAVRVGIKRARQTLQLAAYLAVLAMAGLLFLLVLSLATPGVVMASICLGLVLVVLIYLGHQQQKGSPASALIVELPAVYLGFALVVFRFMPILLLGWLSLSHPEAWLLAGLSIALLGGEAIRSRFYTYQ